MQAVQVPGALLWKRNWPHGSCRLLGRENKLLGAEVIGFGVCFLRNSFPFDRAMLGAVHSNALLMSWTLQGADTRALGVHHNDVTSICHFRRVLQMTGQADAMGPFPEGFPPSSLTSQQLSSIPPSLPPLCTLRLWSSLLPIRTEAKSTEGIAKQSGSEEKTP